MTIIYKYIYEAQNVLHNIHRWKYVCVALLKVIGRTIWTEICGRSHVIIAWQTGIANADVLFEKHKNLLKFLSSGHLAGETACKAVVHV